jgi:MFS transporter, DHA1 family, multidrug resistance protein
VSEIASGAAAASPSETEPAGILTGMNSLYIIAFTVQLGMGVVAPILPDLMQEFTLAAWQAGMVVTMFGLARLLVDLPLGVFLDKVDRTVALVIGTFLIVAGSIVCGLAQEYNVLLAARFVTGTGAAMCTVTTLFSISRAAGATSRGRTIGTYQAAVIGGNTFGPTLGGMAAVVGNWRASFFFCAATGVLAMALALFVSRSGRLKLPKASPKSDHQLSPTPAEEKDGIAWNLLAINFTTFMIFFNVSGFRNSMVPIFGGNVLGIGAGTLGILLGGSALIRFFVTLFSGFASDRYGRKVILIPGILLMAAGTIGFTTVGSFVGYVLFLGVHSLGGFGNSVPTTMVVDAVPPRRVAMAIGVNRFVADAGVLLGPVALGWLLDVAGFTTVAVVATAVMVAAVPAIALTVHEKQAGSRSRSL